MALALSGSTSRVEYTTNIAATTAMSWCGWVENPIATGTTCKMLACQEDQWRISLNAEKYGGGTPTAGSLYFGRSWGTTDHVAQVQSPGATWSAKNHVACTYDGSATTNAAKFYLNGTLLSNSFTRNAAGSIDNATGNPNLGNDNAHTLGATGTYGPASFHNVVLTRAEILEHMATGYTPRGRYVDWWCDDATTVRDRSGNGRSGTVTGGALAAGPPIRRSIFVPAEWTKKVAGGTNATVTAAPCIGDATLPAPAPTIAVTVAVAQGDAQIAAPVPLIAVTAVAQADATLPAPAIAAQQNRTIAAVAASADATLPAPVPVLSVSTVAQADATAPAPLPSITVTAVAQADATLPAPTVSKTGNASIAATAAQADATLPAPTPRILILAPAATGAAAGNAPNPAVVAQAVAALAVATLPAPTVGVTLSATVLAVSLEALATFPVPVLVFPGARGHIGTAGAGAGRVSAADAGAVGSRGTPATAGAVGSRGTPASAGAVGARGTPGTAGIGSGRT